MGMQKIRGADEWDTSQSDCLRDRREENKTNKRGKTGWGIRREQSERREIGREGRLSSKSNVKSGRSNVKSRQNYGSTGYVVPYVFNRLVITEVEFSIILSCLK